MTEVYLDLDGVFADFDRGLLEQFGMSYPKSKIPEDEFNVWHLELKNRIVESKHLFWANLSLIPGSMTLWESVKAYKPTFLTAYFKEMTPAERASCEYGKRLFVEKHFGSDAASRLICCLKEDKKLWAVNKHGTSNILFDDQPNNIKQWQRCGGIGFLYRPLDHL